MSSFTVREPLYYHREYGNDVANWQQREVLPADRPEPGVVESASWANICARGAVALLPFISLYKPASFPLSLGLNGLRTWSSLSKLDRSMLDGQINPNTYPEIVETGVAVIALASTLFAHPLGMVVTTGHDLLKEVVRFAEICQAGGARDNERLESLLKIANHMLYFGLFVVGGMELMFASLALQILLCLHQSRGELRDGKYIEAVSHFAMACVRGSQLYDQAQALRLKWEIDELLASIRANYTQTSGGVGERWQFPSDHLPVGAKVGNATILSWNVLNKNFISWVYNNSQGLNGSMITQLDKPSSKNPALTQREELVIQYILQMVATHQNLILALQECHPDFAKALASALPSHMGVIATDPTFSALDIDMMLYDKTRFRFLQDESAIVKSVFINSDPRKSVTDSLFQELATGQKFQVVNAHIPGDPAKPGREEFAKYLLSHAREDAVTIGLGDMNFKEHEMQDALSNMAHALGKPSHFVNLSSYNTNISPYTFDGKSIDHIWVDAKQWKLKLDSLQAEQVLSGLQATVTLLAEKQSNEARLVHA